MCSELGVPFLSESMLLVAWVLRIWDDPNVL